MKEVCDQDVSSLQWVYAACDPKASPWCCVDRGMAMATDGRRLHLEPCTWPSGWYDEKGVWTDPGSAHLQGARDQLLDRLAHLFAIDEPLINFNEMPMGIVLIEPGAQRGWPLPPGAQPKWDDPVAVASKDLGAALAGLGPRMGETVYMGYTEAMDRSQVHGIRLLAPGSGREALLPVYPTLESDHDGATGTSRS